MSAPRGAAVTAFAIALRLVLALAAPFVAAGVAASEPELRVSRLAESPAAAADAVVVGRLDPAFVPLPDGHHIPAASEVRAWYRIEVPATRAGAARVLTVTRLPLESLRLYRQGDAADTPRWEDSFYRPSRDRIVHPSAFVYELPPSDDGGAVYYLAVEDRDPTQVRLALRDARAFERSDREFTVLLAVALAVLTAMALTNLVFWIALRDAAYLHYVGFIVSLIAFVGCVQGLPYGIPGFAGLAAWGSHAANVAGAATGAFGATFCARFVDAAALSAVLHRALLGMAAAFVVIAIVSATGLEALMRPMRQALNYGLLGLVIVQLAAGLIGIRRGSRAAGFFLIAWSAPIVGTGLRAIAAAGWMPLTPLVVNAFLVGQVIQSLVLSIGLADRTRELRRQRDRARGLHRAAEERLVQERTRRDAAERRADFDALTGLRNRGRIEDDLADAVAVAAGARAPLSLLFIDVDHFKQINDRHGHAVGDLCLALVARGLSDLVRERGLCGRWGGEEFIVVLPGSAEDEALELAERIRLRIAETPVPVGSSVIGVTVSIGLALHAEDELAAEPLVARADRALYVAKREGRNRVERAAA